MSNETALKGSHKGSKKQLRRKSITSKSNLGSALLYLSPALLIFLIFIFYPILRTVYLSFFITNRQREPVFFDGLQNYINLFQSQEFYVTAGASFLFILYVVPPTIIISLFLAVLANMKQKGEKFFKIIFSITLGVSVAASAVIFRFFYHPEIGLFNNVLSLFNIPSVGWLTDPNWALLSISITTIWINIGFNFIVLTGGLQNIPKELYESAQIDGAGWWHRFLKITIPQLSPIIFFVTVVLVINTFQSFAQIDVMTAGGPAGSTNLIVYSIYQDAFIHHNVGSASAQAIVLFIIVLIVTYFQFKLGEKRVHYQ